MTHPASHDDDSLTAELAQIESWLTARPAVTPIVLGRLGELGADARVDLRRLRAERTVKLRRPIRRSKVGRRAARVAAAMAILVAGQSMVLKPAAASAAGLEASAAAVMTAAGPVYEVKILDQASGKPIAGVKIKTVEEDVIAVTDGRGQASVPQSYANEPVLSLEREGYPMVLLEGAKLTGHSLIAMSRFSDGKTISASVPHIPVTVRTGSAADPAERLMALADAHSRPAGDPAPAVAAAPKQVPMTQAEAAIVIPPPGTQAVITDRPADPGRVLRVTGPAPIAARSVTIAKRDGQPLKNLTKGAELAARAPRAEAVMMAHGGAPAPTLEAPPHMPDGMLAQIAPLSPSKPAQFAALEASIPAAPKAPAALRAESHVAGMPALPAVPAAPAAPSRAMLAIAAIDQRLPSRPAAPAQLATSANAEPAMAVKPVAKISLPASPKRPETVHVAHVPLAPQHHAPVRVAQAASHGESDHASAQYAVVPGDTLSAIALRELGSAHLWPVLYAANRHQLTNPRWLPVGLALAIPRTTDSIGAAGANVYTVRGGDSLSAIALAQLGDARKWPQIFAANRHHIKNPWLIFPGQRLVLPTHIATGISPAWATLSATAAPPLAGGPMGHVAD